MRRPVVYTAAFTLAVGSISCSGTKQSAAPPQPSEAFLFPQTLFAFEGRVYVLDSNEDKLEVVHPKRSVEQLPFDVPLLSSYKRDARTEWISSGKGENGYIWERKVGERDWKRFETDSSINQSIVFEGSLYVEHRFPGQSRANSATISRFENGMFVKSWTTAYTGMSRSSPPTFLDENKNLARISDGEKFIVLKAADLTLDKTHDFNDVFAVGCVGASAFLSQGSTLKMISNEIASNIEITVVSHWSVAVEGKDVWVVARC